jgi:hypothetical protein
VINASSRSGTNAFHGSAYEFLRNDKLEARNFFDTVIKPGKTTASPPTYRQNQFGGSLGGPIKHDKAFFFGNFEAGTALSIRAAALRPSPPLPRCPSTSSPTSFQSAMTSSGPRAPTASRLAVRP